VAPGTLTPAESQTDEPDHEQHDGHDPQEMQGESQAEEEQYQ
jgi:hypothetical protein